MLLSNDIGAALVANPDLMYATGIDIDAVADGIGNLLRGLVLGVRNGQAAAENEMGCQTVVRMRGVVGIRPIGPGEDVGKPP